MKGEEESHFFEHQYDDGVAFGFGEDDEGEDDDKKNADTFGDLGDIGMLRIIIIIVLLPSSSSSSSSSSSPQFINL